MNKTSIILTVGILSLVLTLSTVHATIITYEISGYVSDFKITNLTDYGISVGDPFRGQLNFDLSIPDLRPTEPANGFYDYHSYNQPIFSFDVRGKQFGVTVGEILVSNNSPGLGGDYIRYRGGDPSGPVGLIDPWGIAPGTTPSGEMVLEDNSGNALSSDAQPTMPNLYFPDQHWINLASSNPVQSWDLTAQITSIHRVPEPSTGLLLGIGLLGLLVIAEIGRKIMNGGSKIARIFGK